MKTRIDGHNEIDYGTLPNAHAKYGIITARGKMVSLATYLHDEPQGDEAGGRPTPIRRLHWREDVPGIETGVVLCLIVAASAFRVYGVGLIAYPEFVNVYGWV